MRAKNIILVLVIGALAAAGGWFAARHWPKRDAAPTASAGGRKILYYQSAMHPWIKSDKPGRCTICGMQLSPVYEGESGFQAAEGLVTLGSNSVQVINVQTEVATNRTLARTLHVAGTIDDDDTKHRRISAYAEGRVEKLFVNFVGAEVVAGQPLAVFYSPALLGAESEYFTVLNQKLPGGISETLQQERARLVDSAAQRLKRLGYSDAQLAALTNKSQADARTEILAPMTGTVVLRNVYEGQYVKEGEVLFEIADFATMWFQFDAYERDLSWLRVGQQVEVATPALPGKTVTAPITFIDPNLNEMTRSAKVRVELTNAVVEEDGRKRRLLFHKMYADGAVKFETPVVTAVPRTAVLHATEPLVYVEVGPGAYEQRKIKLGRRGDDYIEVLEGVQPGEHVVTTGNMLIDAQAQLDVSARSMSGPADTNMTSTKADTMAGPASLGALTPAQQETVRELLKLTSDLGAALASDDINKFNDSVPNVHAAIPKLLDSLGSVKALRPALQKLEGNGHLEKAKDIAAGRKEFLPFSMAAAELAKQLRTTEPFKATRIFNCPMVDRAIPGAAKNAQWIQLEPPLRNPFFGADMLDCGTEVKP
jgi:Cu(I)/Ag(I) efflux system membrane fusion protein